MERLFDELMNGGITIAPCQKTVFFHKRVTEKEYPGITLWGEVPDARMLAAYKAAKEQLQNEPAAKTSKTS